MCIVWWSSGCPHCHRLCLVPVPVPPDGQQQQPNNNEPQTNRNPPFRSGPETLWAQAPAGTTCTNNTIPHATTTTTHLSWIQNPFELEAPCLGVQGIWRCYEVDTGLSVREALRSEMAGVIAWGRGIDGSCGGGNFAGPDPNQGQKLGPMAGKAGGVPGTDSESGHEAGLTRVNTGPPAPENSGTSLVNPYFKLNLTHASRRQGSRLPNRAATAVPNNLNLPLDSPNSTSPSSVVDGSSLSAFCSLFDSESPSPPPVGTPSRPRHRFFHLDSLPSPDPHITEPDPFPGYCDVFRFFRGLWTFPSPWPSPRLLPVSVPNSSGGPQDPGLLPLSAAPVSAPGSHALRPIPGVAFSDRSRPGPQQPLPQFLPPVPIEVGYRTFPEPFSSKQSGHHHRPGYPGPFPLPGSNVPDSHRKGGLESFRLCPFLQHLDASDPEEKHPREECWLTRYRWMEIRKVKVLGPSAEGGVGRGGQHMQHMERQWFRLLQTYLPFGGRGSGVVMGDISG